MTSQDVKRVIAEGFTDFNVDTTQFLRCGSDNNMVVNEEQELNGESVINLAGQGSLYLTEEKVNASLSEYYQSYMIYLQ